MATPRLEINLGKISANAHFLSDRLGSRGISVTGITKGVLGAPEVALCMLSGGVGAFGDSRIENIERLRKAGSVTPIALIRPPMISQVERVVASATLSYNTEIETIHALSEAASRLGRSHGVVLLVEMGDGRDGISPADLVSFTRKLRRFANIAVKGLGANFACLSGVAPRPSDMINLSRLADHVEAAAGVELSIISGGNSTGVEWALSAAPKGRINDMRIGEAILLGKNPSTGQPIPGLHTDAISLIAEVIETKQKPAPPLDGDAEGASAHSPSHNTRQRSILALGHQDTDPNGLDRNNQFSIIGATSDHLVISSNAVPFRLGAEVRMTPDYNALMRAMASPFVTRIMIAGTSGARGNTEALSA